MDNGQWTPYYSSTYAFQHLCLALCIPLPCTFLLLVTFHVVFSFYVPQHRIFHFPTTFILIAIAIRCQCVFEKNPFHHIHRRPQFLNRASKYVSSNKIGPKRTTADRLTVQMRLLPLLNQAVLPVRRSGQL
ncbi:hypothetical protein GGU11DRAFT_470687 [Lentinula aff. detonsa]|nr:hypothetical protein GGU11DRAFT_470687 [Lentinula aff. detonsa]